MSGKRHHFIPRFLQSEFSSHKNGGEVFTWVYRKGAEPFNTNIINVGVEGLFYSHDGDVQLDDEITKVEERYSALITALRNGNQEALSDSAAVAELLAHLEIRTRHLRQNFSVTAGTLMDILIRFIDDKQAFGSYVQRKIRNDPSILHKALLDQLGSYNLPEPVLQKVLRQTKELLEQQLPSLIELLPSITAQYRAAIPKMLKEAAKSGHIKGLRQTLAPPIKVDAYQNFKFKVIEVEGAPMPLGDSMLIFQLKGKKAFKPFSERGDSIEAVYLPLSTNRVLVGSIDAIELDMPYLPTAIGRCSLEYFISSSISDENECIHAQIGESTDILSHEQIEALIETVISE